MNFNYPIGSIERALLERALGRKPTDKDIQDWAYRIVNAEMNRLAEVPRHD